MSEYDRNVPKALAEVMATIACTELSALGAAQATPPGPRPYPLLLSPWPTTPFSPAVRWSRHVWFGPYANQAQPSPTLKPRTLLVPIYEGRQE